MGAAGGGFLRRLVCVCVKLCELRCLLSRTSLAREELDKTGFPASHPA